MIKTNVTIKKNMIIYESLIYTATHTYPHQIDNEIEDENGCDKIKCSLFFSAFSVLFGWSFFSLSFVISLSFVLRTNIYLVHIQKVLRRFWGKFSLA